MDFSNQNESGGTLQSTSEVLCNGEAIDRLDSVLDLRGLSLIFSSVENIPGVNARAAFTVDSAAVFRSQVVEVLQDSSTKALCSAKNPINGNRMHDVVNFIRYRPGTFRLWHTSATAKLFSPPKLENKKDSKGYLF